MAPLHTEPKFQLSAFNCPHCEAYAKQRWHIVWHGPPGGHANALEGWWMAFCEHCGEISVWTGNGAMHYPHVVIGPLANADLPADIRVDYEEARVIGGGSPRGAAALLRLAIQKLAKHLGGAGENLNADIALLVKNGLPAAVQKSLDVVRVIGNESVHPGTIDVRDDPATVEALFRLVNFIAEKMITEPAAIDAIYAGLPPEKRKQIDERDKTGGASP